VKDIFMSLNTTIEHQVGYLNLFVVSAIDNTPLPNATVTIYVRDVRNIDIPIMMIVTTLNPILVQLPVAHSPGTIIEGPENGYSIYDIKTEAVGYYISRIYDIRVFNGISSNFNISMIPISVEMQF